MGIMRRVSSRTKEIVMIRVRCPRCLALNCASSSKYCTRRHRFPVLEGSCGESGALTLYSFGFGRMITSELGKIQHSAEA